MARAFKDRVKALPAVVSMMSSVSLPERRAVGAPKLPTVYSRRIKVVTLLNEGGHGYTSKGSVIDASRTKECVQSAMIERLTYTIDMSITRDSIDLKCFVI